ncbi:diguanylate cyclase (GGDEF)-like protein [Paucibacter oligotrophus]|uniref:diguanylate cyclase n=1 Tax=Roseateles oligotrophus TaxID=1769250 RepID=A0A840L255_9BURK|nr:diguanylate cyclase (GGDEF)-like protein [Roseateles oligotrophus]
MAAPGRVRTLARALLLLGLLGPIAACKPGSPPPASHTASAPQLAELPPDQLEDAAFVQAFEAIERVGLSQGSASEKALRELQLRTAVGSLERLEVLTLRGAYAARAHDDVLVEQILLSLQAWPEGRWASLAQLSYGYVKGEMLVMRGERRLGLQSLSALPAFSSSNAPRRLLWRCHNFMQSTQTDLGNFDGSVAAGHEALKLGDQMGHSWRRAFTLANLAYGYVQSQYLEQALQTIEEAHAEALKDPDPLLMYTVSNVRAIVFSERREMDRAEQVSVQTQEFARQTGSEKLLALALSNHSDLLLKRGRYAQAQQLAEEALPLALATKDKVAEAVARYNIGLAKIAQKRVLEGRREVLAVIAEDERQEAAGEAAVGWLELGEYLERAGDLGGAVNAYHQHRRWADQALRADTRKAMLETQASYDDERRAKELVLLGRNNSLKAEQLRARDLQIKLWAAVGACVVLSSVLLGLAYQRILKTNAALARSNEALRHQSERDPLTGLANRRFFQAAIKRQAEDGEFSGTLFLIDIDHFKRINDNFGHAAGDSVLVEVAKRLRATLREVDLVVRWGGEEFLILVAAHAPGEAKALAQRLLDQIASQPVLHGRETIRVTASIGFACLPIQPHGLLPSWERAIDLVDTAMYLAKAHGRNRAYGVESIEARDEPQLQQLAAQMESSWQGGQISLQTLQGPVLETAA